MRILYTLVIMLVCMFGINAQCYDIITLTNAAEIECTPDGFVTLEINFQSRGGQGNACVQITYIPQTGPIDENTGLPMAITIDYPQLSAPTDVTLENVDCDQPLTLTPKTAQNCNGTNCSDPVTYPTIDDWISVTLPVELYSFSLVTTDENKALLKWQTSSEIDNDYFEVERSTGGKSWTTVGRIAGSGNTSEITAYEFLDRSVPTGKSYYRLVDVDYAGNRNASQVLTFDLREDKSFITFPNPVEDILSFEKLEPKDKVSIFSQDGKLIYEEGINESNVYNYKIDFTPFHSGVYMVRVIRGQEVLTDRIIKN